MSRPIDFYFDFASPYGFLAAMKIEAIAGESGRSVTWRPFLLGAVYKQVGQSPLEHPLKRAYVIDKDVPRLARLSGLEIKVPQDFPSHSIPAARTFYWLDGINPVMAAEFARAAYRAYWLDGKSTSDANVAVDAAAMLGLDRNAVVAGMQEQAVKDRFTRENEDAIRKGVFGSPFIFVDGEPFWGGDRLDQVAAWAQRGNNKELTRPTA